MSRSPTRLRGFTLIEVMIAIALTALMGGMISMAFNTGIKAKEIVEGDSEHYRMLRAAMNRMCREIAAAYVSDRYDLKRYRDQYDRPTNFVGARDRLLFTSLAHQRLYGDAKESDQTVIEYWSRRSTERDAKDRDDLVRRANPDLDERMDRGGTEDVLYEGVKKIEFQYWDHDRKEWDDEWDTRRPERKAVLPSRVKITLSAIDETGKEVSYTTQTRIMLNTEFGRFD